MEASSNQQQKEKEPRVHRPCAFDKMEGLVREMQDSDHGVPVRSQKHFLTSIPSAFMGYDLIEWLNERLSIEETVEAVHIANQLCQYGYFFPVNDSKTLTVKDDSSLYRFQTPYYWPWQHRTPDNVEYAIYLAKRTLRNKPRLALEDYEIETLNSLRKNLSNKWDLIEFQAQEQVKLAKDRKKGDKIVSDSQERAFWRIHRPPPGCLSSLEVVPVPTRYLPGLPSQPTRKRTLNDLNREVELLKNSLTRIRIKVSTAIENLRSYYDTFKEYDPMCIPPQPSNPWITDDQAFWQLNGPLVEVPTVIRVKRWSISLEELMRDPTGLLEFTNYLRREYSHENIRFWLAVKDLRHSHQAQISDKVNEIFKEFLAPGAPCEINIDGKTMEKVTQEMKNQTRFTFDSAAEHVYMLLLKKDCYPRFIRSDQYRNLSAAGALPSQKKRFFVFGGQTKKKPSSNPMSGTLQQQLSSVSKRRGSDRSLSGSAHELAICGVHDISSAPRVPHSHSQSNLTDIPYRDPNQSENRPVDDVCPWDTVAESIPTSQPAPTMTKSKTIGGTRPLLQTCSIPSSSTTEIQFQTDTNPVKSQICLKFESNSRKNSSQMDSCSSSSEISLAVDEIGERFRKPLQNPNVIRSLSTTRSLGTVITNRVKLIDTIVNRPSTSRQNYSLSSPQQSFESNVNVPSSGIQVNIEKTYTQTECKKLAESSSRAPLISISAIVGDTPNDGTLVETIEPSPMVKGDDKETTDNPVRDPDTRQDDKSENLPINTTTVVFEEKRDNNVNEVCPWEDEESCRVDAPYVKTYATLGYL